MFAKLLVILAFPLFASMHLETWRGSDICCFTAELTAVAETAHATCPYVDTDLEWILPRYCGSTTSMLCLAYDGTKIVGFALGMPLQPYMLFGGENFCCHHRLDVDRSFYVGQVVLLEEYRRTNIGHRILQHMERCVRREQIYLTMCLPCIEESCLCAGKPFNWFWPGLGFELWEVQVMWQIPNITVFNARLPFCHTSMHWIKHLWRKQDSFDDLLDPFAPLFVY